MQDPFPTTRWSLILQAQQPAGRKAEDALAVLCEAYWFPLYAYIRRRGVAPADAADLVQGFFGQLLERRYVDAVRPGKGRFRAFLLHKMKHFLANEWEHAGAQKRGGGTAILSLDVEDAEARYGSALATQRTPETEYERRWALQVVDRVVDRLAEDAARKNRSGEFQLLRGCLTDAAPALSYRELAVRISTTEAAIKSKIYRLRKRFGRLLREEVADTLQDLSDVDDEVRHLFHVLA